MNYDYIIIGAGPSGMTLAYSPCTSTVIHNIGCIENWLNRPNTEIYGAQWIAMKIRSDNEQQAIQRAIQ